MTEEQFSSSRFVPREFIDFVLHAGGLSLDRHRLTKTTVSGRYEQFLARCNLLLQQYDFARLRAETEII